VTPEQLELVRATVGDVAARPEVFSTQFYDRLFSMAPETRDLFPDDLAEQRRKLAEEFTFLASAVDDLPRFVERARDLGARHHRYGVRPDHYAVVGKVLLAALADVLGARWDRPTMLAWQRLYWLMAETMLEGSTDSAFV
jgi:hemoglobin-like flavoprotein